MITLETGEIDSPIGTLKLAVHDGRLCALEFPERWQHRLSWLRRWLGPFTQRRLDGTSGITESLAAYFGGRIHALDDVPIETLGTSFQRRVWSRLRRVRPGQVVSYGELAHGVGMPGAARAVGAANGANPIAIVVPCHRAIGSDGQLTGYAGGLDRKRWLLAHEGVTAPGSSGRASASAPPRRR